MKKSCLVAFAVCLLSASSSGYGADENLIELTPGKTFTFAVESPSNFFTADPEIAEVGLTNNFLVITAKNPGTTALYYWEGGQVRVREIRVRFVQPSYAANFFRTPGEYRSVSGPVFNLDFQGSSRYTASSVWDDALYSYHFTGSAPIGKLSQRQLVFETAFNHRTDQDFNLIDLFARYEGNRLWLTAGDSTPSLISYGRTVTSSSRIRGLEIDIKDLLHLTEGKRSELVFFGGRRTPFNGEPFLGDGGSEQLYGSNFYYEPLPRWNFHLGAYGFRPEDKRNFVFGGAIEQEWAARDDERLTVGYYPSGSGHAATLRNRVIKKAWGLETQYEFIQGGLELPGQRFFRSRQHSYLVSLNQSLGAQFRFTEGFSQRFLAPAPDFGLLGARGESGFFNFSWIPSPRTSFSSGYSLSHSVDRSAAAGTNNVTLHNISFYANHQLTPQKRLFLFVQDLLSDSSLSGRLNSANLILQFTAMEPAIRYSMGFTYHVDDSSLRPTNQLGTLEGSFGQRWGNLIYNAFLRYNVLADGVTIQHAVVPEISLLYYLDAATQLNLTTSANFRVSPDQSVDGFLIAGLNVTFGSGIRVDRFYKRLFRPEKAGSVLGRAYKDVNENGTWDPQIDQPLADLPVYFDGREQARTKADGAYKVKFKSESGTVSLSPRNLPPNYDFETASSLPVTYNAPTRHDFVVSPSHVGFEVNVFDDADFDGLPNSPDDFGLRGIRIAAAQGDKKETCVTEIEGLCRLHGFAKGDVVFSLNPETIPDEISFSEETRAFEATEDKNYIVYFPGRVERSAQFEVFADANGNSAKDENEKGVSGVVVSIGPVSGTTDRDGAVVLRGLKFGDYPIEFKKMPRGMKVPGGFPATLEVPRGAYTGKIQVPLVKGPISRPNKFGG